MLAALLIGLMGLDPASSLPPLPAPVAWSPDGRWLAYVVEARATPCPAEPGWLFRPGDPVGRSGTVKPPKVPPASYRLWASRPDNGESVMLEESRGPLSAPCWSRDGTRLAFARVVRGSDGSTRWETVVQDAPDRQKVLTREPIAPGAEPSASAIRILAPAFSGDGRFLAVPTITPAGLAIVRSDSGTPARAVEGGSRPCWSAEDARLLLVRSGVQPGVYILDTPTSEPRRVADAPAPGDRLPSPLWSRDGQSILSFRRVALGSVPGAPNVRLDKIQVVRSQADTGMVQAAEELKHDEIGREGTLAGSWFSAASDADDFYYAAAMPDRVVQVSWSRGRLDAVDKKLIPFDESAPLGGLAARPGARGLAFRVGMGEAWTPPAVCDPEGGPLTLLAPDAETRDLWRSRILATLIPLLRARPESAALPDGTSAVRPTLLPAPGECDPNDPVSFRLFKLAKLGLTVLGPPNPETDEVRLAFAYLAGDDHVAMDALDALLTRADSIDRRIDLLSVRAQIFLMRRDFGRARFLIDHLRSSRLGPSHAIEDGPSRPRLVPIVDPRSAWPAFLAEKARTLKTPPPEPGKDLPGLDAPNPDVPRASPPARTPPPAPGGNPF